MTYIVNKNDRKTGRFMHITNYSYLIRGIATDLRKRYNIIDTDSIIISHTCIKKSRKYPNGYRTQFRKIYSGDLEGLKAFAKKWNDKHNSAYTKRAGIKKWFWSSSYKKKVLASGHIYDPKTKTIVERT